MHVEKYTKSAVGHLLQHYNRAANHTSNQDIRIDKMKFNYNLITTIRLLMLTLYTTFHK